MMAMARMAPTARYATIAALAVALTLGPAGCATVIASGPDQVPVATNPAGAYVYVNGQFVGQTPTTVSLDRDAPGQIQIYLPGFRPVVMMRDKSLNGWFIGSLLLFYTLIPLIVDLVTGNHVAYDEAPIAIGLTPDGAPPPMWYQPPVR